MTNSNKLLVTDLVDALIIPDWIPLSAWLEHLPFAAYIMSKTKPTLFVELGTHYGASYAMFCEAVLQKQLDAHCFAVDTWEGDPHAGEYGEDVYNQFAVYHNERFGSFSTLLKMTFGDALNHFADNSIDLLHVDGYHTYEATHQYFVDWLPKMSSRGIILFHDINVREDDFGVWQVWDELTQQYPNHFAFLHGHGLGVLAVGDDMPDPIAHLFDLSDNEKKFVRKLFAYAGKRWTTQYERNRLAEQLHETKRQHEALEANLNQAHEQEKSLRHELDNTVMDNQSLQEVAKEKDQIEQLFNETLQEKQSLQTTLDNLILERSDLQQQYEQIQAQLNIIQQQQHHMLSPQQRKQTGTSLPTVFTRLLPKRMRKAAKFWRNKRLIEQSRLFDEQWYRQQYPDVVMMGAEPISHYLRHGANEGRDPSPAFSTRGYMARYPDVAQKNMNPLVHYIRYGATENRQTNANSAPTMNMAPLQVAPTQTNKLLIKEQYTAQNLLQNRFPSLQPIPTFGYNSHRQRLNLVTDSINSGSLFGGVATALIFATLLANQWDCDLRIITRTQSANKQNYAKILKANGLKLANTLEFFFADQHQLREELPIAERDIFLTTSWWTTEAIRRTLNGRRIIYLLQEDERTFYPYGDDRVRCVNVLQDPDITFVINSKLLYDYFLADGFNNIKAKGLWFEPSWSQDLFYYDKSRTGKKNFFFYARPGHLRNLFYVGLDVLRTAVSRNIIDLNMWDIHFVGTQTEDLTLGQQYKPKLHYDLAWNEYAKLICQMDAGLSLMYSPHPSYPPIDLAASGAVAITNRYANKQSLTKYSDNIICCDLDTEALLEGVKAGIELANNQEQRYDNYTNNSLLRDWDESFKPILQALADYEV